jgi:hypothetical protein
MSAWEEYQAAAQRLDRVRRDAAAAVTEQAAALQAAKQELAAVRQRIALQRARITDLAARAGLPAPALAADPPVPEPAGPAAATALLRTAVADLDAADAEVSTVDTGTFTRGPLPDLPQPLRNTIVYGGVALLVLLVQILLLTGASGTAESVAALAFAAILPAIGYGVSLVIVGLLYGRVERTPVLGAAISAVPVVLWCLWTFAARALFG